MKYLLRFFILSSFLAYSCIEDVDLPPDQALRVLTVDGGITTLPGPHTIKLSRSARYGSVFVDVVTPERFASVSIRDNSGSVVVLSETVQGTYVTPAGFKAEVGQSYSLQIKTIDGREYLSFPEEVRAVPKIDSLSVAFKVLPTSNVLIPKTGIDVLVYFKDNPEERNFYMWRSTGKLQLNTRPDLFVQRPFRVPAPKECCATCWVDEISDKSIRIFSDRLTNGNSQQVLSAFIEDNGYRFRDKYMARIYQYAISENAYQFYRLVEQQATIEGSIFDPPPATIRGNFIRFDDPDELVIGYFTAADVAVDSIFIRSNQLDFLKPAQVIPDDCRTVAGATANKPDYW